MFAGKKSAQIREILINESAWEEMTCLFALSLSDLINQRLSGSLSVEERIGEKPEWMRNLDPYLANHFSNIELPLPSPLKEYQEKMDEIDSIINDMMVLKEYFRAKFYDEIK